MLVKDRMTPKPTTITPDTTFPEAFRLMREKRVRHLPVVDEEGKLVGVVARTDLLHASPSAATTFSVFEVNYLLANLHVREVMSSPPITVSEDDPLEEAAQVMVEKKIGCLPVMRDGMLVGVITETDIFETFVEILGGEEASLRVTVQVPDVRGELARLAEVIARLGGNICSVAAFRGEDPQYRYITFRLEGVDEETLLPVLKTEVEEIVHVCCVA
ncbi:MAG: CBS and ACT domain-containing protein [Chloroflexi bacterium]|nr:CBS and ACT domain-containing protein [Chloroflexota bacterium]MBU1747684.1 CBS and ACT domain-containing protein [Chloroflexota bacterium]MBU1878766.1 CBS and ACT domain-containing protein [Chloroflexota bacterium]